MCRRSILAMQPGCSCALEPTKLEISAVHLQRKLTCIQQETHIRAPALMQSIDKVQSAVFLYTTISESHGRDLSLLMG